MHTIECVAVFKKFNHVNRLNCNGLNMFYIFPRNEQWNISIMEYDQFILVLGNLYSKPGKINFKLHDGKI